MLVTYGSWGNSSLLLFYFNVALCYTALPAILKKISGKREGHIQIMSPDHSPAVNTCQIFHNARNSSQSGAETEPKTEAGTETDTRVKQSRSQRCGHSDSNH